MDKTYNVSTINSYIKRIIEGDHLLKNIAVKGEISNFKAHYTGHLYFTLKDSTSNIKCVMFKGSAMNLKFKPADGDSVILSCSIGVFEREGAYQLYVNDMQPDGVGSLYLAYEQLKEKLEQEGLFDNRFKKDITYLPSSVGVITSQTGSVIRDIINVSTRRFPNINLKIISAAVQGKGAAETIVNAIEQFNELNNVDTIIIARGGGSIEDLWAFNEEVVARAVFESKIPIISAVGHETDFTICDFVADLRAPTPSSAAEIAVPLYSDIVFKITNYKEKLRSSLLILVESKKKKLQLLENSRVFTNPFDKINQHRIRIDNNITNALKDMQMKIQKCKMVYMNMNTKLDSISPLKTLSRGYSILQGKEGNTIRSINELKSEDNVNIVLQDGSVEAVIK